MEAAPTRKSFWRSKKFLYGLAIFFAVGIVVSAADDSKTKANTPVEQPVVKEEVQKSPAVVNSVSRGEEGYLDNDNALPDVLVAATKEAYGEFIKASASKDDMGIAQILYDGRAFLVMKGTKVLVIDSELGSRQIRILEGDHSGKSGWVVKEFVVSK